MRATRFLSTGRKAAVPLTLLSADGLAAWLRTAGAREKRWIEATGFRADPGTFCSIPAENGGVARVLAGVPAGGDLWGSAFLATALPEGTYEIDPEPEPESATRVALAWALATYTFERYRPSTQKLSTLRWPRTADRKAVEQAAEATYLVRDLINTPTEDLGPAELAASARALARKHGARCSVVQGKDLLTKNYPCIHAVGRASTEAPRLIDLRWTGAPRGPKVTLVGKGVVFDSGGLDIKPAAGMRWMKKDMGGSAHVLGIASMILDAKLPLRLRVLIPAVENAISGNAFRPGDILRTRKGTTVEVGNTDAEGRLILCDALAEADRESPDLLVDFATLTGAARVALGTDLPAVYARTDELASRLLVHAEAENDPLWRMPLFAPYRELLNSPIADLCNVSEGGFGGSITAALFLGEFVSPATPWIHVDLMAWNLRPRPGRPIGGEAMGMRAVYRLIEEMARGR